MTRSAPSFLPSSLKTIQARAIFPSSDPRSGIIPATIASAMSPRGSLSSTSSTWKGDTWRPSGVLNVSLTLPTMLQEEIHWATMQWIKQKSPSQLTKSGHSGPLELNLRCVSSHRQMLLALLSRRSNNPKQHSRSGRTTRQLH